MKKGAPFYACGLNDDGQLGLGDDTNRNTFTVVPFFDSENHHLMPCLSSNSNHTFAIIGFSPITKARVDLTALLKDTDLLMHCDLKLIGSDGVTIDVHRSLISARCPNLLQYQQLPSRAPPSSSFSFSSSA